MWPLRQLITVMRRHDMTQKKTITQTNTETKTMTKTNTFRELHQRAILETYDLWHIWPEWWGQLVNCDIWDTDYNLENWEPEFMTIFVTWQLRATLDSIRNSCDVYYVWWTWHLVEDITLIIKSYWIRLAMVKSTTHLMITKIPLAVWKKLIITNNWM